MSPEQQLDYAIRALEAFNERGGHASDHIAELSRRENLETPDLASVSSLFYGVLRNERKLAFALQRAGLGTGMSRNARLLISAYAIVSNAAQHAQAEKRFPNLDWTKVVRIDETIAELERQEERVALFGSLPDWLARSLVSDYGADAEALAKSLSEPAPRFLRANTLLRDRAQLQAALELENVGALPAPYSATGLQLTGDSSPFRTQSFHDGGFELQDEASQLVCELVAPPPRSLVVDMCAGAGGKTLALAAALQGKGRVVALDISEKKLVELRKRARRAQATNIEARAITPDDTSALTAFEKRAERVLVDAPCSGTGVLRRNPEARRTLTPESVTRLIELQHSIVLRAAELVAPGGRLVYATCSLLHSEGEAIAEWIGNTLSHFEPVDLASVHGRAWVDRFVRPARHMLRTLPHIHGTDGFFVACFRRKRTSKD